ncbi:MAG: hypothetical protein ACK5HP_02395 [Bacilli bacterium]
MVNATDRETSSATNGKGNICFCSYCGTKLDIGARYCKGCVEPVIQQGTRDSKEKTEIPPVYSKSIDEPITERKTVYEGYIHKCPNCGEVLESFVTNCPACRYEIRDAKPVSIVRELALKLERIEAQKMPIFEEEKSVMKMVFGKDFKERDEAVKVRSNFEEQKKQEKATVIINYSVPNTKEDILEFMILASSNIDTKHELNDVVTKAWISKLDQVYQKAEISMGKNPEFVHIKNIYEKKQEQIKLKKVLSMFGWGGLVVAQLFLLGLLWNPVATIAITVGVAVLLLIGFIIFRKR